MSETELKARIISILSGRTREMEGYSYFSSNPGIPEDEYEEIADEVIAALASQWQPIESAPKDGTFYLATNGQDHRVENCPDGYVAGIWHRIDGDWRGCALGDDSTHWQPLPPPPGVEG